MGLNRDLGNIPEIVTVFNGNFGIGTNGATRKLDLNGDFALSKNGESIIVNDQRGTDSISIRGAANVNFHTFTGSVYAERMRITPGGNVLIGTTTDNGNRLQVNGSISTTSLRLSGNYNTTVTTDSNWSSYQTIIPPGALNWGVTYLITIRWDYTFPSNNQPYYCYCSFLFMGVITNGGGTDNEFTPICSTHTGSGSNISFRSLAGGSSTTGIQARLNNFATRGGTLSIKAILME